MEFFIRKTLNAPMVRFEEGVLIISGRSIPENAISFFQPLFKFIVEYSENPYQLTEANILLEYANSSTNRSLMTVFTLLEKIYENGNTVQINWYYEKGDELMFDLGNDFKTVLSLPFQLREKDSLS
jgi:hypothetical protein